MQMKAEGVRKIWDRYKYVALVALIGAGLLLWPSGQEKLSPSPEETETAEAAAEGLEAELDLQLLQALDGLDDLHGSVHDAVITYADVDD